MVSNSHKISHYKLGLEYRSQMNLRRSGKRLLLSLLTDQIVLSETALILVSVTIPL